MVSIADRIPDARQLLDSLLSLSFHAKFPDILSLMRLVVNDTQFTNWIFGARSYCMRYGNR